MHASSISGDEVPSDSAEKTVALVKLLTEIGPDVAEISRRLGQFKESVRYRYKEKIVKAGFQIKADLDYSALGLTRVVMKVKLSTEYVKHAAELFDAMSDLCYVVAYAGTTPYGLYIVHGGIPSEFTSEFHRLMEQLKSKGIFEEVELFDCDWFRVAPMRAECYDFAEGVWDFDWSNPPPIDDKAARATNSERKRIDKVDLLIVKELWKDSTRSMREIQGAIRRTNGIDINYKTLAWHYRHHVLPNHLIRDYSITWHGVRYSLTNERLDKMGKHEYLGASLIVRGTSEQEKMSLRGQLNRIPFQWSEASGEIYYSQLFLPLESVNEALDYLKRILRPFGSRAEFFLLDLREMKSFTIGHMLWDDELGWTFDAEKTMPRLESSLMRIRERGRLTS